MSHWDQDNGGPSRGGGNVSRSQHQVYFANNRGHSNRNHYDYSGGERSGNNNSQGNNHDESRLPIDISHTNLHATAAEFKPGASYYPRNNGSNGAIKKTYNGKVENGKFKRYYSNNYGKKKQHNEHVETDSERVEINNAKGNPQKYNNGDNRGYRGNGYRGNKNGYYKEDYSKKSNQRNDNWRQKEKDRERKPPKQNQKKVDAGSQRERLEHMVTHRTLECLVCCERLRHTDRIWSCKQCFHILHLSCVIKWAKASRLEEGWRCPACQNVCIEVPHEYRCYCGKFVEPKLEPGGLPHSCGEVCGRKGRGCEHRCTLLCHPGPCPDCNIMIGKLCGCGATKPTVKCSSDLEITCQGICDKTLNCSAHKCTKPCHISDCEPCKDWVRQECYCGKVGRKVKCTEKVQGVHMYKCGDVCGKKLGCGNHSCERLCHEGDCESCELDPRIVKSCPCGATMLNEERKSCLDPIPCCDKICGRPRKCGQPSRPHLCQDKCHEGDCVTCTLSTLVRCRCGHMDRELPCKDLTTKADDARCQKKCTKQRLCCKHKCNQFCCIEIEHICPLPCNRILSCGQHRCEESCHRGRCPPCWRTSFEEHYCECGFTVLYPPVACGTRPPPCSQPCSRSKDCGHPATHNCHTGACPPCTVFTSKYCHGKHEMRQTIPCYQKDFSCGMPCNKELPCRRHKCIQICHSDQCPTPCGQKCKKSRPNCEHHCNQPCHDSPCPSVPCKQNVTVTCQCGLRTATRSCLEVASEYQKIATSQMASKMAEIQRGQSVDISDIVNKQKKGAHKLLDCNDECRLVERNRRMAIGLQIRNPDLSSKLTPRYTDFMKGWAKKDSRFCQHIHDKLTELVQLAKQSKQKNRSHSFECMNREKRQFVHEYCEHFGVDSAAYDKEPNRNVVATAYKEKSWLPSCSLLELLQRESGQRKVPGPVLNKGITNNPSETVSLRLQLARPSVASSNNTPSSPAGVFVDYFDNPPA
ncbi:PREDICTED: protein shuttle craft [Nicrophorus vespilloides]|uniref:Protein shuttle craft n=1 Tax=Nicrophorus vespilloides TaxID=110193 RepID=A0ABM1NBU2_NICVS|nr:PREDICTED: protein shuttle craft [Nicrophorus vespilloides]